MDIVVGIDLGTTNSAVAHLTDKGPEIIPNALGQRLTPSVVGIDDTGGILVGSAAKEYQVTRPDRCASLFKRLMGTDQITTIGGREFSPEELSGLVLRSLRQDAEAFFKQEIVRAVITVPAYFNDRQRKSTIAAGRIAGFVVERILNEPTAAAIAYGFHEAKEDKTILVFDLGGGTFDVSVVELFEGTLEVRSSAGETSLGGEDFTRSMAARVLEKTGVPFERAEATMPLMVSRIIQQCERAKCRLSQDESAVIRIPDATGDTSGGKDVTITRSEMELWVLPTLSRVDLPIRRALTDAKLTRDRIHEVILVGGATRMPLVTQRVKELFNKTPNCQLNPDEVVALGAAVQAGLVSQHAAVNDMVVTDVSPFTLGIEVGKEFAGVRRDGYFDPVIDRNTTIPVSRSKSYCTIQANQTSINISVYQGESRMCKENLRLGEFEVEGIPRGPAGQEIEIRFTYDLNGVLEVEATITATKKTITHVIAKNAQGLSEAQIKQALRKMQQLKIHPRDDEVNRYILRRAERLFKELSQDHRRILTGLLDGFEASLESRDAEVIERHRDALQEFLDYHDSDGDPVEVER